jgi:hypothetical protein
MSLSPEQLKTVDAVFLGKTFPKLCRSWSRLGINYDANFGDREQPDTKKPGLAGLSFNFCFYTL